VRALRGDCLDQCRKEIGLRKRNKGEWKGKWQTLPYNSIPDFYNCSMLKVLCREPFVLVSFLLHFQFRALSHSMTDTHTRAHNHAVRAAIFRSPSAGGAAQV